MLSRILPMALLLAVGLTTIGARSAAPSAGFEGLAYALIMAAVLFVGLPLLVLVVSGLVAIFSGGAARKVALALVMLSGLFLLIVVGFISTILS